MNSKPSRIATLVFHVKQTMAELRRLESPISTEMGGILITFPSGLGKTLSWKQYEPIADTLEAAKEFAAKLVHAMLSTNPPNIDDLDRTNIPSLVAGIQEILRQWNVARIEDLRGVAKPVGLPH